MTCTWVIILKPLRKQSKKDVIKKQESIQIKAMRSKLNEFRMSSLQNKQNFIDYLIFHWLQSSIFWVDNIGGDNKRPKRGQAKECASGKLKKTVCAKAQVSDGGSIWSLALVTFQSLVQHFWWKRGLKKSSSFYLILVATTVMPTASKALMVWYTCCRGGRLHSIDWFGHG